ncbi:MAG: hypothetical protein JWO94_2672, partial [Verrucomicrobiaceae bacterium]|nr:hypothetical protein [Verrucomicrobiaceae bacterium]
MPFLTPQELEFSLEKILGTVDSHKDRAAFNTFDMEGDATLLDPSTFPQFHAALAFLDKEIKPRWRAFDTEANGLQKKHKWIAQTAIVFGVMAVIMVLLQFGLQETGDSKLRDGEGWNLQ